MSQSYLTSLWNHEAFPEGAREQPEHADQPLSRWFTLAGDRGGGGGGAVLAGCGDAGRGLKAFISVLIVACPCALALAAPFTLGTAQRLLARRQVFLKNGLVLERMAQVEAIVFDKTGTLTAGGAEAVRFVDRRSQNAEGRRRVQGWSDRSEPRHRLDAERA